MTSPRPRQPRSPRARVGRGVHAGLVGRTGLAVLGCLTAILVTACDNDSETDPSPPTPPSATSRPTSGAPAGTRLADGLSVPAGATMIGPIGRVGEVKKVSAWYATLSVTDPKQLSQVVAALRTQAGTSGFQPTLSETNHARLTRSLGDGASKVLDIAGAPGTGAVPARVRVVLTTTTGEAT